MAKPPREKKHLFKFDWIAAMIRCRSLTGWQIAVGTKLGLMATNGEKSATVYAGVEKLSLLFGGRKPSSLSAWRAGLVDAGWLADSGERRARAVVYKLVIPACNCAGCGGESPAVERPRDQNGRFLPAGSTHDMGT